MWRRQAGVDGQGLNQRDAGAVLGVSQGLYSKYERGEFLPRPERARAISEITGVPFDILRGWGRSGTDLTRAGAQVERVRTLGIDTGSDNGYYGDHSDSDSESKPDDGLK